MKKTIFSITISILLGFSFSFASIQPIEPYEQHLLFLRDSFSVEGEIHIGYWIYANARGLGFLHAPAPGEGVTCIDDVARAGLYYLYRYRNTQNEQYLELARETINFTLALRAPNGDFWNFVLDNGQINRYGITSSTTRNWWALRALWLLSEAVLIWRDIDPQYSHHLFSLSMTTARLLSGDLDAQGLLRGYTDISALFVLGLCNLRQADLGQDAFLDTQIRRIAEGLVSKQRDGPPWSGIIDEGREQFHWSGWGTRQVHALVRAYQITEEEGFLESAKKMANRIYPIMLATGPIYSISDFVLKEYEQIAYAVEAMITSLFHLYQATGEESYAWMASIAMGFFYGNNQLLIPMVTDTGAGFDGLERIFINRNAGAESTISYLLARALVERIPDEISGISKAKPILSSGVRSFFSHQMDPGLSVMEVIRMDGEEGMLSRNLRLRASWTPFSSSYQVFLTGRFPSGLESSAIFAGNYADLSPSLHPGWIGYLPTTLFNEGRLTITLRAPREFFLNQIVLIPHVPYQILEWGDSMIIWAANIHDADETLHMGDCSFRLEPDQFLIQAISPQCIPAVAAQAASEIGSYYEASTRRKDQFILLDLRDGANARGFGIPREPANFDNYGSPTGAYYPLEELQPRLVDAVLPISIPFWIPISDQTDHIIPMNQKWNFSPIKAKALHLLGSCDHGDYQAMFVLEYADGSKDSVPIGFSDWCGQAVYREEIGIEFPFRYLSNHQKEWIRPKLFIQTIHLRDENLVSVTFPTVKTMHIFGLTLE